MMFGIKILYSCSLSLLIILCMPIASRSKYHDERGNYTKTVVNSGENIEVHRRLRSNCSYSVRKNAPEIYFINMDSSIDRKRSMEKHLRDIGMRYFRVRGNPWKKIYIPSDVNKLWATRWCMLQTEEHIPSRSEVNSNQSSELRGYDSIMNGLCGRGKDKFGKDKNLPKELGCTTSHLLAMQKAIYSKTATSRYALIIEDDVKFPFDVDYDELTKSAPEGFGILQLFNSNKQSLVFSFNEYINKKRLWHRSENLVFWSTCGYLIDREVMKPIIDKIVFERNGWQYYNVIAGISGPCAPAECCVNGTDTRWGYYGKFVRNSPCTEAAHGYQADSYLYSLANTYMLGVPLISNGKGGNSSTFHQDHVELLHRAAFKRQRQIINEMLSGKVAPPPFMRPACNHELNTSVM